MEDIKKHKYYSKNVEFENKHKNVIYDGYSLNYLTYNYLEIHYLIKLGILVKIG